MKARSAKTRTAGLRLAYSPAPGEDAHPSKMLRPCTIILLLCNAYEQHVRWVEYSQMMMQDLELGIPTQQTELHLPQSDLVRINDMAP